MRTCTIAAMMIALLPTAAYSQRKTPPTLRTDEQMKTDAEVDKAYQNAIKATREKRPAAPAKIDPWQTVRTPGDNNVKR